MLDVRVGRQLDLIWVLDLGRFLEQLREPLPDRLESGAVEEKMGLVLNASSSAAPTCSPVVFGDTLPPLNSIAKRKNTESKTANEIVMKARYGIGKISSASNTSRV